MRVFKLWVYWIQLVQPHRALSSLTLEMVSSSVSRSISPLAAAPTLSFVFAAPHDLFAFAAVAAWLAATRCSGTSVKFDGKC
jgi:hypothetical protein